MLEEIKAVTEIIEVETLEKFRTISSWNCVSWLGSSITGKNRTHNNHHKTSINYKKKYMAK